MRISFFSSSQSFFFLLDVVATISNKNDNASITICLVIVRMTKLRNFVSLFVIYIGVIFSSVDYGVNAKGCSRPIL